MKDNGVAIRLSSKLANEAKVIAEVMHRSVPKQIEYWAMLGKACEENPDLTFEFIKDIFIAQAEIDNGLISDYEFN